MKRTKKRIVSCLAAAAVFASAMTGLPAGVFEGTNAVISASAADALSYDFDSDTGELTITGSGTITSEAVNAAVNSKLDIKSVVISGEEISIGSSAFAVYSSLTDLLIGDGVNSIGDSAFEFCTGLRKVTFGRSLTSVYSGPGLESFRNPFFGVTELSDVYIYCDSTDLFKKYSTLDYSIKFSSNSYSGCTIHVLPSKLSVFQDLYEGAIKMTVKGDIIELNGVYKCGDTINFYPEGEMFIGDDQYFYNGNPDKNYCNSSRELLFYGLCGSTNQYEFTLSKDGYRTYIDVTEEPFIPASPWGIRVKGGNGTESSPYSFSVLLEDPYSTKKSLSGAEVTVSADDKTTTVKLDGSTVDADQYTVTYYPVDEDGRYDTHSGSDTFPVKPGTYKAVVEAAADGNYKGAAVSGNSVTLKAPTKLEIGKYFKLGEKIDFGNTEENIFIDGFASDSAKENGMPYNDKLSLEDSLYYLAETDQHVIMLNEDQNGTQVVFPYEFVIGADGVPFKPWGIKLVDGSGLKDDPFVFEPLYADPLDDGYDLSEATILFNVNDAQNGFNVTVNYYGTIIDPSEYDVFIYETDDNGFYKTKQDSNELLPPVTENFDVSGKTNYRAVVKAKEDSQVVKGAGVSKIYMLTMPMFLVTIPATIDFGYDTTAQASMNIRYLNCDNLNAIELSNLEFCDRVIAVTIAEINNKELNSYTSSSFKLTDSDDHTLDCELYVENFDNDLFNPMSSVDSELLKAGLDNSRFYVEDSAVLNFSILNPQDAVGGVYSATLTFQIKMREFNKDYDGNSLEEEDTFLQVLHSYEENIRRKVPKPQSTK